MGDFQVLIVDDQHDQAEAFAQQISATTGLRCMATDDPDRAIEAVIESPILIAVLDQNMPALLQGTELFAKLRQISPDIGAIMLTQEDDLSAAEQAMRLRYKDRLHKSRVSELPEMVLRYYLQAEAERAANNNGTEILLRRDRTPLIRPSELWLVSRSCLSKKYIDPEEWQNVVEVHVGQERHVTDNWQIQRKVSLEEQAKSVLSSELGVKAKFVADVTSKISASLETQLKTLSSLEVTNLRVVEDTFRLPDEPTDPNQLHIRLRRIEFAPVYTRYRIVLRRRCGRCTQSRIGVVTVRAPSPVIKLRQTDFMSDHTTRTNPVGYRRLPTLS